MKSAKNNKLVVDERFLVYWIINLNEGMFNPHCEIIFKYLFYNSCLIFRLLLGMLIRLIDLIRTRY